LTQPTSPVAAARWERLLFVPRIFISYRRDDAGGHAGRLCDRLIERFGKGQIFRDLDAIDPGADFVAAIQKAVGECDVLLALIGKHWSTITDNDGRRRLEDARDFVRLEIVAALQRKIRVIPVLVQGAAMPGARDLPDVLRPLAQRNAFPLSDVGWDDDVRRLMNKIRPRRVWPRYFLIGAAAAALVATVSLWPISAPDDATITANVKAALSNESRLGSARIEVTTLGRRCPCHRLIRFW
jgi:TIR domain